MKYSFLTAWGFILLILLLGCGVFSLCLYLVFEGGLFGSVPDPLQSFVLLLGAPLAFLIFAGMWGVLSCSGRMLSPLTALITAPAVLLLAGGLRVFGALFGGISGMPHPVLLEWGLSLGFSLFAGWLIPCKFAVPVTWLRRYVPLLLLPPLLCLIVLSFYLVFVDPEPGFRLQAIFPWAAGAWGLFVLGFLSGTRKAALALERRRGLVVAAGLVSLTALIVGVNLYVATCDTQPSVPEVPPTPETIRNGSYPLSVPLVAVTKTPVQKEAEVLLRWMCGPEGQDLIRRAGYVPLSGPEENRTAP